MKALPKLEMKLLSNDRLEINVSWPKPNNEQEAQDISRMVANFFLILDNAGNLKPSLQKAVAEYGILTKQKEVAENILYLAKNYEDKKMIAAVSNVGTKKNKVVVPARRALEP